MNLVNLYYLYLCIIEKHNKSIEYYEYFTMNYTKKLLIIQIISLLTKKLNFFRPYCYLITIHKNKKEPKINFLLHIQTF